VGEVMKKENRVKKSSEIEMIVRRRNSRGNKYFVLYKKENHENTHFRFAVSVSKKYGNAPERNKIKRRVREIISSYEIADQYDLFIVVKTESINLSFAEIKDSLDKLVRKQDILR
jgi:ribonuclease P protein component